MNTEVAGLDEGQRAELRELVARAVRARAAHIVATSEFGDLAARTIEADLAAFDAETRLVHYIEGLVAK
ncbi:hypothetical protein ACFWGP_05490 [Agromyces sp. NPDC127015]|uniref:hypothetical protein n=1 Tax=Agromyces sp. NPDC127015 TaxID=3347108 RepID=UPI003666B97C